MIDERTIELINKELDGLNDETESKELEQLLGENEEALQYYDELLRAASTLKRMEHAEPPSFLKTHILNTITNLPAKERAGIGWIKTILEAFSRRTSTKYAVVFASGLCVGILLLIIANPWRHPTPDPSEVGGSMILPTEVARMQRIDSVVVDGDGFRAVFRSFEGNGAVAIDCAIASADNIRLELSADPEELRFVGVNRLGGTDNDVMAMGGRVIFTGTRSERSLVSFFEVTAPQRPIEARLFKGGTAARTVAIRTTQN